MINIMKLIVFNNGINLHFVMMVIELVQVLYVIGLVQIILKDIFILKNHIQVVLQKKLQVVQNMMQQKLFMQNIVIIINVLILVRMYGIDGLDIYGQKQILVLIYKLNYLLILQIYFKFVQQIMVKMYKEKNVQLQKKINVVNVNIALILKNKWII